MFRFRLLGPVNREGKLAILATFASMETATSYAREMALAEKDKNFYIFDVENESEVVVVNANRKSGELSVFTVKMGEIRETGNPKEVQ